MKFGVPGAVLAAIVFLCIPVRRRWRTGFFAIVVLMAAVAGFTGCGSSSPSNSGGQTPSGGTSAGAYTVTVSGVDSATGKITAQTTVSVTVN
jgi:hypothetical protein